MSDAPLTAIVEFKIRPENDRQMPFCDRNPGKNPYPQRSRPSQPSKAPPATSAKAPLKPLNIQTYLPPSTFRMVILPMHRMLDTGRQYN